MSQIVVVERSFAEPAVVEAVPARERRVSGYLREHRVAWLRTFASRDLRRMLCFYDAPDVEAVRVAQDRAGVPFDRIWSGISVLPTRPAESPDGYTTVVVERGIAQDITEEQWRQRAESGAWCMAAYRVKLMESVFAPRNERAVCVFIAPDTEAVRMANSRQGSNVLLSWPCHCWRAA